MGVFYTYPAGPPESVVEQAGSETIREMRTWTETNAAEVKAISTPAYHLTWAQVDAVIAYVDSLLAR